MFQYSDSFQVFVKADCVIHKTISKTGYRRPRIPFITYLLFQTARPKPANLCEKVKAVLMLSDNLDRRIAASFGVIGYRSDSVKPKITEKCIFYIFFYDFPQAANRLSNVQNTPSASSSAEPACEYTDVSVSAYI